MKKIAVLFFAFILSSCGIKNILAPDLSGDLQGIYQVYLIGDGTNNTNLPSGSKSVNIELTPIDKSTSSYIMTLINGTDSDTQEGIFELKKSGEQIDLYEDGNKIGFIKNSELNIDYTNSNGLRSIIKARK